MDEKNIDIQNSVSRRKFTLLDLIFIYLKYKKNILIFTSILCAVSIILYFFVFDLIYFSTASIKSSGKTSGLLSALGSDLPDLGGFEDFGLGGGKSAKELAAYEEILKSRRCLEPLIVKFDLMEKEDYRFMEDAVKDFREDKMHIVTERVAGLMYLGVYYKDPQLAKEMVEFLLGQLNEINTEMNVLNAKNNREFIEKRYYQAKDDLTKAEDSLKSFQFVYGIAPDLQIKAAAQSVFTLEAELKAEEVKLDVIKQILSADQPEVKTQEAKVNSLKSKISEIQTSTDLNDFLRLGNSPQVAMSFLRLQRDVEIQTKILTFILPLYEQSKIEEKRDTPSIIILDKPYVAERKTKPKRLIMVFLITFFGFIFSLALASVFEYYENQKINNTETYRKFSNIFQKSKKIK